MKFAILKSEEHKCTMPLWKEVFAEDTDAFVETYYEDKGRNNTIFCLCHQGEIVSMIHWNPRKVCYKNQILETRFLVAVATKYNYRRQGCMAKLLQEGFRYFYKQKLPFLYLTPADERYYEPFGFVTAAQKIEFPAENVRRQCDLQTCESHCEIKEIPESSYAKLAQLANKTYNKSSDLYIWRDEAYYQTLCRELQSEDGHIMGVYESDELVGSFLYTAEGGMYLREFLGKVPLEHPQMSKYLTEGALIHQQETTMIRVLHLPTFVSILRTEQIEIHYLTITDNNIPENNGNYKLEIGPEGSSIGVCPREALHLCEKVTEAEFVMRYITNVRMTDMV